MAEYTPSEDEVRLAHVDRRCFLDGINRFDVKTDEEYGAEFDRWLASHDARVRRDAKAEAWDEGYGKGSSPYPFVQHNPYREQED